MFSLGTRIYFKAAGMYALSFDMVVSDLKQYYDDQITAGNMTTQHVKNTLRKILRDEFNIR